MGNSQSYDVTNVHHRNDKRQEPRPTGTVKPLSDGMPPILDVDDKEKQENTSPKEDSPTVTRHSESLHEEEVRAVTVQGESAGKPSPKKTEESVEEVEQEMSNVALETLEREVPQEMLPLDVVPSQSSYDKLH